MKGVWLEAARHQTGRERFGERFDSSGQSCQSSFCPREKILSVSGSRGWALLPELPAAWHRSCSGTFLLLVFLIFEHLWRCLAHTLTQLVILLPLFPSCIFAGTRPHPWSSLDPSSGSSYCCEFSKCCSVDFPQNCFSKPVLPWQKAIHFCTPISTSWQSAAAPGGHRGGGFSPRSSFVGAEMSARGSLGMLGC